MTRKRIILLTLLALLVLAAGSTAYATTRTADADATGIAGPARTAEEYQAGLRNCGGGEGTFEAYASTAGRACVEKLAKAAIDAGDLGTYQAALEKQTEETPGLWNTCHDTGHIAGLYAYEKTKDIVALLKTNGSHACQYGIGHGALDGFAFDPNTNDDLFRQASEVCGAMMKTNIDVFYLCSDGLGHAAWSSTYDFDKAVSRCSGNPEAGGRIACGEGIIMQIYEAAGDESHGDISKAPVELPARCEAVTLPDAVKRADAKFGCNRGSAYIYTRNVWRTMAEWQMENGDAPLDKEHARRVTDNFTTAVGWCDAHLSESSIRECYEGVMSQVPPIVYLDKVLLDGICGMLGEQKNECIAFGRHWNNTPLANEGTKAITETPGRTESLDTAGQSDAKGLTN